MDNFLDILFFAAHPDDIEIACSGTLIKHIKMGYRVGIIDLTKGELGTRGTAEIRANESAEASKILGLHVRENLDLGDGTFENNHETRLKLIEVIRKYRPKVVFINAPNDRHPDHGRAAQLELDACFFSGLTKIVTDYPAYRPQSVYHYLQDFYLKPDFVIDITNEIDQKFEALMCFKSQFYDANSTEPQTPISTVDFLNFLKSRFADLGRNIQVPYAEGFINTRIPGIQDITKDLI